jgi:predicted ATPase/DNA-binding CsgD family transcriptional regulator
MAGSVVTRQVGNLPADLTSFVGRKRELAQIRHLLSASRLVTLTGVGGVGKTRLALRAATEQRRAFDAVWLVDLTGLADPALVVETVAVTIGLRDQSVTDTLEALCGILAPQRTLLVLDNCEHLCDACATLADHLLRATPELRILATSRQSLGIGGEHRMEVGPLPVPEPDRPLTPKALKLYDGVGLFLERASAVLPGFSLTDGNRSAVAELCRRLDGIPLAIELAAVRLRALSVNTLVERLSDRYRCLTGGSPTAVPRQRTLHALIDWSFQLLSAPEQTLWTRMSVLPGHFDLATVESVCAGDGIEPDDVLDLVDALLDKSLLLREEHAGQVRYRMLETLREFSRSRLGDERRALRRRHRDRFLKLADQAAAEWFGPAQVSWFTRLRLERAHLRAAMEFCLEEPGEAMAGLRMATRLHQPLWQAGALYNEGRRWLDRMLAAAPDRTTVRVEALCADAELAFTQGDIAAGRRLNEEARALAGALADRASMARVSLISGIAAHYNGDFPRAAVLLEDALAGHYAAGDALHMVIALITLAATFGYLGDHVRASELFERSRSLAESREESWCRIWLLTVAGIHSWQCGNNTRAISLARESLLLGRVFDDRQHIATTLESLAWMLAGDGRHTDAARLLGAAEEVCRTTGVCTGRMERFADFHDRCVTALRDELGDKAFTRALRQGGRLTLDQAIAEALGTRTDEPQEAPVIGAAPSSPLTAREQEIAELIAQGLSNKEIASRLVIAQRTTEGHVEHILAKLGFNSRTRVAAWVIARQSSEEYEP